eukprot:100598-Prorocentrum_minimum.AAC.1
MDSKRIKTIPLGSKREKAAGQIQAAVAAVGSILGRIVRVVRRCPGRVGPGVHHEGARRRSHRPGA